MSECIYHSSQVVERCEHLGESYIVVFRDPDLGLLARYGHLHRGGSITAPVNGLEDEATLDWYRSLMRRDLEETA